MSYRSQRSETGVCSRRWSRRMSAFSWTGSRFRVFLDMGGPPLEVVAYSSRRLVPFQLKQNRPCYPPADMQEVNTAACQQYDQMVKYATAVRLGTAETEAILRRFTRNNVEHPTYRA